MKKKQIIGLVVAAALFVGVSAASVFTNTISKNLLQSSADDIINLGGSYQFNPPSEDYIAIVRVEGTIQEQSGSSALEASSGYQHDSTMNYIDELMDDSNNKGILLYVDSPGGTVYESEELYQKLKEYKETTKRPIWDYMAHYVASGGYMVSMASDKIYANSNTTTGSIGVIMSGYDMSGLYKKLGIRYVSITSGKNKDSSKFTDEQIAIYQDQINEAYEKNTGVLIADRFDEDDLDYVATPAVLCKNHGPFTWGKDAHEAVHNAVVLEEVAKMAARCEMINPDVKPAPQELQDKHYFRKHGANAYYGQPGK